MLRLPRLATDLAELTGLVHRPDPEELVPVVRGDAAPRPLAPGDALTLVSWNLQYAAGRAPHFFYDGGDAVFADPAAVRETLAGMRAIVAESDLALLQEVDRDSDRTGRVDELLPLAEGFAAWASATYHRSRFVPHPTRRPLGRMDVHLAVLSRFAMRDGRRLALAPVRSDSCLRRAFNLKRAVLTAQVPFGDRALHVAVTHLSAFTRGDGTLGDQVAALRAWMEAREAAGEPFVLAGDLNLLPPGDDPARLPDATEYADVPNPIGALLPRFRSAVPPARLLDADRRTYQPWGAAPDRVLDYVFVSDDLEVIEAGPIPSDLSDHLPVRVRIRLPGGVGATRRGGTRRRAQNATF